MLTLLPWFFVAMTMAGAFLTIKKSRWGFALYFISTCYWGIHNYLIAEYAQVAIMVMFNMLNVYGFWKWSKSDDND